MRYVAPIADHRSRLILPVIDTDTGWAFGDGFEDGDASAWSEIVAD